MDALAADEAQLGLVRETKKAEHFLPAVPPTLSMPRSSGIAYTAIRPYSEFLIAEQAQKKKMVVSFLTLLKRFWPFKKTLLFLNVFLKKYDKTLA